jgi:hypothetical protein
VAGKLILEHLDGEVLVYDTERNEAHALTGPGAAEFAAASDDVSRREVLRRMALAGVAAAGTGVLVKTIVAPTAAQAQSATACPLRPNGTCPAGTTCCVCVAGSGIATAECCNNATQVCLAATATCNACDFGGGFSDRNLKRDPHPADPYRVLGLVAAVS